MHFLGSILVLEENFINLVRCIKWFSSQLRLIYVILVQTSFLKDLIIVSVLLGLFAYLTFVVIGVKNGVSFHQLNGATVFRQRIRISSCTGIFKHSLLKCLQFPTHNYLFYSRDRSPSISRTHMQLNFSVLKYHLLKILNTNSFLPKFCCSA